MAKQTKKSYVIYYAHSLVGNALGKEGSGVKNNKWNVVYYGYMPTLWYANGRRHRARVMPKGEWFCGVLCVPGTPLH